MARVGRPTPGLSWVDRGRHHLAVAAAVGAAKRG